MTTPCPSDPPDWLTRRIAERQAEIDRVEERLGLLYGLQIRDWRARDAMTAAP